MTDKTFIFFSDIGHGWLKVPRSLLNKLGIENKISTYSYQKGDYVYLEEDADATTFIKEYKKQIGKEIQFKESVCNGESQIRNYQSYGETLK